MMFRSLLTGLAMIVAGSASANAGDLPLYKSVAPIASWTGFYVGAHVGTAWGSKNFDFNDLTAAAPFIWESSVSTNGPLAGGQLGFNWQTGLFVFGIEGDASWADIKGHGICNTTTFFMNCSAKTDILATLTGRVGFVIDRTLVYVKGGGAWAHDSYTISNVAQPPLATAFSSSISDNRFGWTGGMGAEYAFARNWSAKIEYDYMDFGTNRYNFPRTSAVVGAGNFNNWDVTQVVHAMKFGINYHF